MSNIFVKIVILVGKLAVNLFLYAAGFMGLLFSKGYFICHGIQGNTLHKMCKNIVKNLLPKLWASSLKTCDEKSAQFSSKQLTIVVIVIVVRQALDVFDTPDFFSTETVSFF